MDETDALPPTPREGTLAQPESTRAIAGHAPRWRRDLLASLVAGAAFGLLLALADVLGAGLVWLAGAVFLPIGIWVGWSSRRPWADGTVYSLAATALVALVLLTKAFPLAALLALFVVLPQGLVGAWVGARLWAAAAGPAPQERPAGENPPPTPPQV